MSVTVNPDTAAPTVIAPSAITIDQTVCCGTFGGVLASDAAVVAFLTGATVTDTCVSTPTQLPPQVGLVDVTPTTCFETGDTTVTFQFQDAALNTGTATATVTVRMFGDLNLDNTIDSTDVVLIRAFLAGAIAPGTPPFYAPEYIANVTHGAEGVDITDWTVIRGFIVGAISCMAP